MRLARMRISRAHDVTEQARAGSFNLYFFSIELNETSSAVMTELALRHVDEDSLVNL